LIDHLKNRLELLRYLPEVDGRSTARAIAGLLEVDESRVLAGGGTTQFIYTACKALDTRRALIVAPTYADYTDGCRVNGIEPAFFLTQEETGFQPDLDRLAAVLSDYDTVFLCNPNNPTGRLADHAELVALCRAHAQVRFLIDESYLPFVPTGQDASMSRCCLDNVIVLWSTSKIFGMPGLRAGFLVAEPTVTASFQHFMQPWCVNTLAQEAIGFLGHNLEAARAFIDRTRAYLADQGARFRQRLQGGPLLVHPSLTSYFLIRLPERIPAETVCQALAAKRFLIRNCANFHGLSDRHIRIALKDEAANEAVARHLLATVTGHRER
jgi:threonine-phosphate decarboxylase